MRRGQGMASRTASPRPAGLVQLLAVLGGLHADGRDPPAWEQHDGAHAWYERAEKIGHRLQEVSDDGVGMSRAASEDCRQIDIWGSAYAAVIRVATKTQADRVADWLGSAPE